LFGEILIFPSINYLFYVKDSPIHVHERMCPLPQQIPIAETSKASTGCPMQDKTNRMGAGGM
jgi:hypothetical protein